ncbi:MAG TPA: hypothetical protein VE377_09370 [Candidatus Dormibacteraeota bacterium]|nr:hypothetical protein [Candidatus Dormibacteraeota bacterium]
MKLKIHRILSIATLLASLIAIVLVLQKPAPVGHAQAPAAITAQAESFDQKMAEFQLAAQQLKNPATYEAASLTPKAEVHVNSDEIGAVLAQSMGTPGAAPAPNSDAGSAAPTIKDQQISFDGDLVHGQFLTEIAGKDVWITVSGHIGEKDGYATFDPTEFKVGDLNVPVSLVNPSLQKKLAEQRDRLKLPDNVGNVKVENSQLVMQQK